MIASFLHLSDIHFKNGHNVFANRVDKLINVVKNEIIGTDYLFIITSGDIAFSGKQEEYEIAKKTYIKIYDDLKSYTKLDAQILFIPGNHDCEFSEEIEEVRQLILDKLAKENLKGINERLIAKCCEPQENFINFCKTISELTEGSQLTADITLDHRLIKTICFNLNGHILRFNLYNTAWESNIKERIGQLKYPIEYIESKFATTENALAISVLHHPLNWQTPEYSKYFLDFLIKTSDLIITGHEHNAESKLISDLDEDFRTISIASPALQESESLDSEFNLIKWDIASKQFEQYRYKYDNENEHKNYIQYGPKITKSLDKIKKLKQRPYQLKESFRAKLEEPGTSYTHSTAENILLKDLFVAPFLQKVDFDEKTNPQFKSFINSDLALNVASISESFFKIILGQESSGKTTLAKFYYIYYYENNYLPIFINSNQITNTSLDGIKKLIEKYFKEQYDELDCDFNEIDFNKVVLIVDDFHNLENTNSKIHSIRNIKRVLSKVIILGNELMLFESFKDKKGESITPFGDFEWYLIKEFNHQLRHELTVKWYRLGKEYMDREERNEFYRKIDTAKQNIDTIVGKNFVPAYPVYILAILQGLESGDAITANKQHAYYYELLITNSLKKVLQDKDDIGFYMTLSKEYFFFLFKEKIRFSPTAKESFHTFLEWHKSQYSLSTLNNDTTLDILLRSRILKIDSENNLTPSYKYLYYYFVALYLADNLDDKEVQEIVDLMTDRLYRDEFANIIIFLIHLARNNYVITKLIEKSKAIYPSYDPCKLESDCDFINKLQLSIPQEVLKNVNIDQTRLESVKNEDLFEENDFENSNVSSENYDLRADISNINDLALITKAVRTLDILGQLTKKYWGELKGNNKYVLAEETFLLGLRVLTYYLMLVNKNEKGLVDHIKKILLKKYNYEDLTTENVDHYAGNFIFSLCSTASFAILKRITNSIGSIKLSDTYKEIQAKNPYNSIELINAAIKLDYYASFPTFELETLREKNEKNVLGQYLIRKFLIEHMYMYDLGHEQRQKLCDKYGIKMEDQRYISGSSQIKKR